MDKLSFESKADETTEHYNTTEILIIEGGPMAKGQRVVVQKMALNKIKTGKNSRMSVSKEELSGLMQSIKEVGLLQPIGVTRAREGGGYEIVYGNRRFLACSKLGFTHIPVVVTENKKASDIDLKNLTENIQRRNIGLAEAGRYIELLKKEGLSHAEIAVRLGVSTTYIGACISAYREVPEAFREDLEIALTGNKAKGKLKGKIAVATAQKLISASKSYSLEEKQTEKLFAAAKSDERFLPENARKYARAIKDEVKDFVGAVAPVAHAVCQFWIKKEDLEELRVKYVDDGPFPSLNSLFKAILSGKKAVTIPIVEMRGKE